MHAVIHQLEQDDEDYAVSALCETLGVGPTAR